MTWRTHSNKLLFITFLLFCSISNSISQVLIKGQIKDESSKAIPGASIQLLTKDSLILNYSFSDNNGEFSIKYSKKGDFLLSVSSLGYERHVQALTLQKDNIITINVILSEDILQLDQVIISGNQPIKIKKDTLVFDTKAFTDGNEEVVEDLLKKIPGISVSEDGTIKVQGKEVEKVMVEGDDFFSYGYKVLTKNMPAQPISEVELLQNYNENRLLRGIDNSDKVALNLKLNDDVKSKWFANIKAGYGLSEKHRHLFQTNIFKFAKKSKYYIIGDLNNTGKNATGEIDHLINDKPDNEFGSQTLNEKVLVELAKTQSNFGEDRANLNNDQLATVNAIYNLSSTLKLKILELYDRKDNNYYQLSQNEFFIADTSFINTNDYNLNEVDHTSITQINLLFDNTKNTIIESNTRFSLGIEKGFNQLIFNEDEINETLNTNFSSIEQQLKLSQKIQDNSILNINAGYKDGSNDQKYSVNKYLYQELFEIGSGNSLNQNSNLTNKYAFINSNYFHKFQKKGDIVQVQAGHLYKSTPLKSRLTLYNDLKATYPSGFQNNINYLLHDSHIRAKYQLKLSNIEVSGSVDTHYIQNTIQRIDSSSTHEKFLQLNPSVILGWDINNINHIYISYAYKFTNSSVWQVYDQFAITGFRQFEMGVGNFNQLPGSSILVNYRLGNWSDLFLFNTYFLYTHNDDFFSTSSTVTPNYVTLEKVIMHNQNKINLSSNLDCYINKLRTNAKINFGLSATSFNNYVNHNLREVNANNYFVGLELRSAFSGFFNYNIGLMIINNQLHVNSESSENVVKSSFTNKNSFIDLSFLLTNKLSWQVSGDYYNFGGLSSNDTHTLFLDLSCKYEVKKNKMTFFLEGKNLLNNKSYTLSDLSDVALSQISYRIIPGYLMLKVEYRF
ncbi:carboxypeptidase-like regulatory domain-containing protein [Fulvivirga maritima]|uniref:TonB-dependent receptor n=1 Tax=Fulvivirga maritima TaxID=2904247 RepID=UPI001F3474A3|nr:carboxypeptidase-like regulatory domain-containing protein [Fulvivirga maritima]UII25058.1 carboxypeptidase-like regulatory domain-containing protein [Fulvivirga maritima]